MMAVHTPSLRREILVWYSLVLIVALSLFSMAAYFLLEQAVIRAATESLRNTADLVEQVSIPQGIPRLETRDEFVDLVDAAGEPVRAIRRRTALATGDVLEIIVALPEDLVSRVLQSFLLIAILLIPLTALAAALGAGVLLERLLDPLRRLVETTREIGIGGLSRRVPEPDRPSDLMDLAQSFNGMLRRLERAVEALRRFTADASHELKTPLTSIQGTIQVSLSRERSADELRETLAEVMEETEWMLHLVDGLLTLARSEEGLVPVRKEPVEITDLLADAVEMGQLLTMEKPVEVELEAPRQLYVAGVAGQLRQVFVNLVSNAVKFTREGNVRVTAREFGEVGAGRWAEVRISDTGVGIPPEELSRVFDRFYRGDAARARPGGTGLGLAIARLLVEQHGGRIDVQSRLGHGSEFRVLLPAGLERDGGREKLVLPSGAESTGT
ncbi:MAG: HAMP domain-containing protein [Gemmatimonas sp.]|nr:HAMP domain-containing protein [Gemmatimonas sp.]